mmetsp:Transcript_37/g.62  ORF Transcript_37/g.62 Transcript_37/m.62 type:complete len:151 (-) Transcript_37:233-685(-)
MSSRPLEGTWERPLRLSLERIMQSSMRREKTQYYPTKSNFVDRLEATRFRSFDDMLDSHHDDAVLVSFGSKMCGPCRLMQKELDSVRNVLADNNLKVFGVDTERFPSLGARFQVSGLPTVMLFKQGKVLHKMEGLHKADDVVEQVRNLLS